MKIACIIMVLFLVLLATGCTKTPTANVVGGVTETAVESNYEKQTQEPKDEVVLIKGAHTFIPRELTINKGDMVVWKNVDDSIHKLLEENDLFISRELSKGDVFTFTFEEAGEYDYRCIYTNALGKIIVE